MHFLQKKECECLCVGMRKRIWMWGQCRFSCSFVKVLSMSTLLYPSTYSWFLTPTILPSLKNISYSHSTILTFRGSTRVVLLLLCTLCTLKMCSILFSVEFDKTCLFVGGIQYDHPHSNSLQWYQRDMDLASNLFLHNLYNSISMKTCNFNIL